MLTMTKYLTHLCDQLLQRKTFRCNVSTINSDVRSYCMNAVSWRLPTMPHTPVVWGRTPHDPIVRFRFTQSTTGQAGHYNGFISDTLPWR
jgi:hypothetical protein